MRCDAVSGTNFTAKMVIKDYYRNYKKIAKRLPNIVELFERESASYPYDKLEVSLAGKSFIGFIDINKDDIHRGYCIHTRDKEQKSDDFWKCSDEQIAIGLTKIIECIKKASLKSKEMEETAELMKKNQNQVGKQLDVHRCW